MKVFIARGTEDIGSFPQEQLPQLARTGEIKRTDTYWHDGMDTWEPLSDLLGRAVWEPGGRDAAGGPDATSTAQGPDLSPMGAAKPPPKPRVASPAPTDWRKIAAAFVIILIAVIILGLLVIKPDTESMEPAGTSSAGNRAPAARASSSVVREKVTDELRQRIERLPKAPVPPLNTYYFDVSIDVTETSAMRAPYVASIRGRENVVDPETKETMSQTEFNLTAEFAAGEWVYKSYNATTLNVADRTTTAVRHDSMRSAPPVLVAVLGLKTSDRSSSALPPAK